MTLITTIQFPVFSGIRCLMMPFIQGDPESVPLQYKRGYENILSDIFIEKGKRGYLTIDESFVDAGKPHRGARAKYGRALHTEAGLHPDKVYCWGGGGWGKSHRVTVDGETKILLANSIDNSCALWNSEHKNTSIDGDIGDLAEQYPYKDAVFMKTGEVHEIGIFTPHESMPVKENCFRQFLRIVGDGVNGREEYFTVNPLLA